MIIELLHENYIYDCMFYLNILIVKYCSCNMNIYVMHFQFIYNSANC